MSHIANHIHNHGLAGDNTLHVVGVVSNPERWHSRYRLTREWLERMQATPNVKVHLVEAAFGHRHHEVVHASDSGLKLHIETNAWVKENMINLGVRHLLPLDWSYVAWVDTDVEFRCEHWAQETLHQLQHYHLLQPWQHCADLTHNGSIFQTHASFGYRHQAGDVTKPGYFASGHPGYAWACTRVFWEQVGGLLDIGILGSGDRHMATAAVGAVEKSVNAKLSGGYLRRCQAWQQRAMRLTHGEVGFTVGRIEHHFHGPKARRFYKERWQILVDHNFDPDVDLMRDAQGVLHIVGKPALEQAIRKYNRSRMEDSIEES